MKERRLPVPAYVAINEDDENIIVNTLRADQELPSVTQDRVGGVKGEAKDSQNDDKKGETKKSEDDDGEEGLAVLPVAGLWNIEKYFWINIILGAMFIATCVGGPAILGTVHNLLSYY